MTERSKELREKARQGGTRYLPKLREQHKLTARERLDLLLDKGSFIEDGLFANVLAEELPADGVITGLGNVDGRGVAVMANDPTVKAGSWGARTVEKIIRIQETAARLRRPLFYLVDSAGARITDQIEMFPGRRHAGRIFFNEVQLSGAVPQICLLFGPSAAGGAYIPAFCDVVVMVEGNASMYLGSPRMVEVVVGEKVTLEELGGARMHNTESGLGDALVANDQEAIEFAKRYFSYMPNAAYQGVMSAATRPPRAGKPLRDLIPDEPNRGYDMRKVVDAIRRARLHDRNRRRAPRHYPPRREDDQRRLRGHGAQDLGHRPQGLRRRPVRDGGTGVRLRRGHRPAVGADRGHGS